MNSLKNQVLALVIALIAATTVAMLVLFWVNTSEFTRASVSRQIGNATDSFNQLLASRQRQLVNSAALLTADFGFKEAVATRDERTIVSALDNHGSRAAADLMFVIALDGSLIASNRTDLASAPGVLPFSLPLDEAAREGAALTLVAWNGNLFQLVLVPVRAPRPIAFTAVGFALDRVVAQELKAMTGLDITFLVGVRNERTVTTLGPDVIDEALSAPADVDPRVGVPFADAAAFVSRRQQLTDSDERVGELVLTARLEDEVAAFTRLRNEILAVSALVLLMAVLGAMIFARNITRPLNRLVQTALRMARGNYDAELDDHRRSREVSSLFQAFRDMGRDIKQREEWIRWQAEHDELTGLLSRHAAIDALDKQLTVDRQLTVIVWVIEGLRDIADALGPDVADDFIRALAERMKSLPDVVVSARPGSNELLIVIEGEESLADEICRRATATMSAPVGIRELSLRRMLRAGWAAAPADGDYAEALLRRASIAVDRASHEGTTQRRYQAGEEEDHVQRLRLINDLRDAINVDDGQLYMTYQPKQHLASGRIDKLEALIRWNHPEFGFVSPEVFIELAEQSNLIGDLTDWVLATVLRQRAGWQADFPALQVAVNVSAQDLERDDLLAMVTSQLGTHGLAPGALCFEMTERDMMTNADKTIENMRRLREYGFDISVDDYGIGQSSLSKLREMPVTEIKIDKAFIMTLDETEGDQIITQSTIDLGHRFGLRVIAEGVENEASRAMLTDFGCDYIQGYLLARPMPAIELEAWLRDFTGRPRAMAST